MKHIIILVLLSTILMGCNKQEVDSEELSNSVAKAQQYMKTQDHVITTATSSDGNSFNFRIFVEDMLTHEQAKDLVFKFNDELEGSLSNKELFRNTFKISYDIKSEKNGAILFIAKRNKGEDEFWWQ